MYGEFNWELFIIADPRVKDYFMMGRPWPSFAICIGYIYLVTVAGPKFMANRQPYNLRHIMLVYNFSMVVLSFYVFLEVRWSEFVQIYLTTNMVYLILRHLSEGIL